MGISKAKKSSLIKADATADIGLINRYSVKELTPNEVYCFSVVLCDNDVDRDLECFSTRTLKKLAPMFVGKTGISDHNWSANKQVARIYRAEVEETAEKTALNEPLNRLVASAYILDTETNKALIESIEGGITKEVSVGCRTQKCNCSICGEPLKFDWRTWTEQCETGHIKGETYDSKLCAGVLEEPTDAYEFSFVAVPAQRGAGVTKSAGDINEAFDVLLNADLSACRSDCAKLMRKLKATLSDREEMGIRAKILEENNKFIRK